MPTVLVAPDAFKGTLAAPVVAAAIGRGVSRSGHWATDLCPVADGGEGTLDVLLDALGGTTALAEVADPLGRRVEARLGLLNGGRTAIVEVAQASGLHRVTPQERDPEAATSAGTGELMVAAANRGAVRILVGAGGSATSDGGAGALEAIARADGLRGAQVTVLCDVRTPFELAAARFAPQKGAQDARTLARLTARLHRQAQRLPRDPRARPLTGAAGGLAGGLWAGLGARLVAGAPFVLDALAFDERLRRARALVVGEGRLDASTLEGKAVYELATRARQTGVPTHAIVASNAMTAFDARILDLQWIGQAGSEAELEAAGAELARVV